jgi:hypothetical protein
LKNPADTTAGFFCSSSSRDEPETVIASEAKQSKSSGKDWIASSRSLSSGAHSRDPLAPRNDGERFRVSNGHASQRAALIERSTASLGQQSTFSPADFW